MENKKQKLFTELDEFLAQNENKEKQTIECKDDVCIIKNDKSLIEVMNKKVITQDGRQLLT
jgi:Holliday junction resolvase-like predicted endonuclease